MTTPKAADLVPGAMIVLADTEQARQRYGACAGRHVRLARVEFHGEGGTLIAKVPSSHGGPDVELLVEPEDIAIVVNVPVMTPGKGADRPSCLVMNPRNVEASVEHRRKMVAAFMTLEPGTQADMLDLLDNLAFLGGDLPEKKREAQALMHQLYARVGLE